MSVLTAVLLGLVQGIAEFLPISSSGHLAIAEHLLNMQGASNVPDFFDVLLHLGTLFAVFAAYWDDIRDMVVEFFTGIGDLAHHRTPNPVPPARRLILLIIVGTLPLFVMVPFRRFFSSLGDNMYFIGGALIFTGILLFVSDRVRHGRKSEKTATLLDALLVGVGQAIALCPGISRSGMTITAAALRALSASLPCALPSSYPFLRCWARTFSRSRTRLKQTSTGRVCPSISSVLSWRRYRVMPAFVCCAMLPTRAASARLPTTAGRPARLRCCSRSCTNF